MPETPTKAYQNREFLMGEDARGIRILCEYLEPRARLAHLGIQRAIIVFGSARFPRKVKSGRDYYKLAAELGERLARWTLEKHAPERRYYLCTGGGPGVMQAVHEGSARVDRRLNIGLNISLPYEQHANPFVEPERVFEFHYFFMRKFWFMNLAQALVVFPGGFGTMDELFEVLTLTQTGKSAVRPVVLFDSEFWRKTVHFEELVARRFINPEDLNLFRMVDTVDEAYAALTVALSSISDVV